MARKSMTTLKSEATSRLPDNTSQKISPADVRETRLDFLDTLTPGYAASTIDPAVTDVTIGSTPEDLTVWNSTLIETAEFSLNLTTGILTLNAPMVVEFQVSITFEAASNQDLILETVFSGSSFQYRAERTGGGTGKPGSMSVSGLYDGNTNDTLKVQASASPGPTDVDFLSGSWINSLRPLINDPA